MAEAAQEPQRVYFDQNCMNARGVDSELVRIDEMHQAGRIVLMANPRNYRELGPGKYGDLARKRLAQLPSGMEVMRWGVSYWGDAVWGSDAPVLDVAAAFSIIFPRERLDFDSEGQSNSLQDVMHIANAEDSGADVFLTRENAILAAREALRLRMRIRSPAELLAELEHG